MALLLSPVSFIQPAQSKECEVRTSNKWEETGPFPVCLKQHVLFRSASGTGPGYNSTDSLFKVPEGTPPRRFPGSQLLSKELARRVDLRVSSSALLPTCCPRLNKRIYFISNSPQGLEDIQRALETACTQL